MASSLERRIREIVSEELDIDEKEFDLESTFVEDLGADSLDFVEIIMALEEEFKIDISDTEAEKLLTLQDVVDFIRGKIQ